MIESVVQVFLACLLSFIYFSNTYSHWLPFCLIFCEIFILIEVTKV